MTRMKKQALNLILSLMSGLSMTGLAVAQEIPESFTPVRPQGMGGAFTAVANDENAVWTNPAGLARGRKPRSRASVDLIKAPNIIIGANSASRDFIQGVNRNSGASDLSQVADQADELSDKPFWATTAIFPLIMFDAGGSPSIAGVYSNTTIQSVVDNDNPDLAKTSAISDLGAVYGMAFTDKTHSFSFGLIGRYVARYAYEDKIPLSDLKNGKQLQTRIKDGSNRSTGVAVDTGMMWTVADFWFPTVGLSILNAPTGCKEDYLNPFSKKREKVCGTVFKGSFENPEAISTVDPTDVRLGLSITPRFSSKLAARIALDLHHLPVTIGDAHYGLDGIEPIKQLHAGIELFVGNPLERSPFTIAMGVSQGYFTFGTTVQIGLVSLEFSTYGRDISSTSSPKEDRRMLFGVSMDF
ncbi:MAG: hypothetical protein EOP07_06120 [Proteobacteria bacterium]|nr:MAG: hypothetical protein EOP07_06120 [Pseudomonadota bacterium]